jgi:hypothetical protein
MNYKALILTLALCLLYLPFASAAHDYYPENKIVDTNPALSVPDPSTYGYVVFNIIAGGAQDKTVWVLNKANVNAAPFDCKFNPDKSERAGQNPDYTPIEVPGIGTTGIIDLQAGSYVSYLQNGNGNQCERRDFIVGGASSSQATQVVFQGAAVSQLGEVNIGTDMCTNKIVDATKTIRNMIDDNNLRIASDYTNKHYNHHFQDPDYGTVKHLRIVYKYETVYYWGQWHYHKLVIDSAKYGTFCSPFVIPQGWQGVDILETEDTNIHHNQP